ncbi:2-hydroxyacid dehydrogenase [Pseudochelatococcus sp. G4_1912]|uniref:2-hydroxyacid dehydrogenase n=1 Tax=Pseudochelatococcus sp. G4_1912 TaxID=3114288 RepID=UPI0039C5CA38
MADIEIVLTGNVIASAEAALDRDFKVHRLLDIADQAAWLREHSTRIRAIAATNGLPVDAALIAALPNLEIIAGFGVGYDNIDVTEAARRGIIVTNTPDVLTDEVADLTVGLLLATVRQIPQADRFLRAGHWLEKRFPFTATLRGRTIGIFGLGRIGLAIAQRLAAFGVRIIYHNRNKRDDVPYQYIETLPALAETADVLIVATPGGANTHHAIDAHVLSALGPDGILINIGRGSIVDEAALATALQKGIILSAGLDVFEDEPRVPQALIDVENTVLLPHVGSASVFTRDAMGQLMVDNLTAWFAGRGPLTPVPETPVP